MHRQGDEAADIWAEFSQIGYVGTVPTRFVHNCVNFWSDTLNDTPMCACKCWRVFTAVWLHILQKVKTYFNISVEQQLLCLQYNVLFLEFVSRQQFGGAVTELQIVTFSKLLWVYC